MNVLNKILLLTISTLLSFQISAQTSIPKVGDLYGGGIVYWTTPDGSQGLIASLKDASDGATWGLEETKVDCKNEDGRENMKLILATPKLKKSSAAKICDAYEAGDFNDWYLPSSKELSKLAKASEDIDKILEENAKAEPLKNDIYYWSSTEGYDKMATGLNGKTGNGGTQYKSKKLRVRPIRSYTVVIPKRKPIENFPDTYKGGKAEIGQFYKGGIIIWVTEDGEHGLLASLHDVHVGTLWGLNEIKAETRSEDGMENTIKIVGFPEIKPTNAAKLCFEYKANNEGGWYLPSSTELGKMAKASAIISKILNNDGNDLTEGIQTERYYWTSTEKGYKGMATGLSGTTGNGGTQYKTKYLAVRAVKKF